MAEEQRQRYDFDQHDTVHANQIGTVSGDSNITQQTHLHGPVNIFVGNDVAVDPEALKKLTTSLTRWVKNRQLNGSKRRRKATKKRKRQRVDIGGSYHNGISSDEATDGDSDHYDVYGQIDSDNEQTVSFSLCNLSLCGEFEFVLNLVCSAKPQGSTLSTSSVSGLLERIHPLSNHNHNHNDQSPTNHHQSSPSPLGDQMAAFNNGRELRENSPGTDSSSMDRLIDFHLVHSLAFHVLSLCGGFEFDPNLV